MKGANDSRDRKKKFLAVAGREVSKVPLCCLPMISHGETAGYMQRRNVRPPSLFGSFPFFLIDVKVLQAQFGIGDPSETPPRIPNNSRRGRWSMKYKRGGEKTRDRDRNRIQGSRCRCQNRV